MFKQGYATAAKVANTIHKLPAAPSQRSEKIRDLTAGEADCANAEDDGSKEQGGIPLKRIG